MKNLNIKKGLRRLVIVLLSFCSLFVLLSFYIPNGCIFDNEYVKNNSYIYVENNPDRKTDIKNFANSYLLDLNNYNKYYSFDIKCFPYKRYCMIGDMKFYDGKNINIADKSGVIKNREPLVFKMPAAIHYFSKQICGFAGIIGITILLYALYLLIELIFCWIIRGFKNE